MAKFIGEALLIGVVVGAYTYCLNFIVTKFIDFSKKRRRDRLDPMMYLCPGCDEFNLLVSKRKIRKHVRACLARRDGIKPSLVVLPSVIVCRKSQMPSIVAALTPAPSYLDPKWIYNLKKRLGVSTEVFTKLSNKAPRKIEIITDSIEPIVAWRAWRLDRDGLLCGVGLSQSWLPATKNRAFCAKQEDVAKGIPMHGVVAHPATNCPNDKCMCGFWGFEKQEDLLKALNEYTDIAVFGSVYLWGDILIHTLGYRAQFAYPKELWLLKPGLEYLGKLYNVPIRSLSAEEHEEIPQLNADKAAQ